MLDTGHILTQADILKDLLEGTIQGCPSRGDLKHTGIIIGASATILTFRNFGEGFPIECAEIPEDLFLQATPYHLESMIHLFRCELLWFRDGTCATIHYEKGARRKQEIASSGTPDGLLIRLEW